MEVSDGAISALGDIMGSASDESPRKGRQVTILRGKHKGKSGIVFWHGKDQFARVSRYDGNWMQQSMTAAIGRSDYRIGVQTESGEKFFTNADYAQVYVNGVPVGFCPIKNRLYRDGVLNLD